MAEELHASLVASCPRGGEESRPVTVGESIASGERRSREDRAAWIALGDRAVGAEEHHTHNLVR